MLSLSAEQRMIVDSLSELAETEFTDDAFEWDGETPWRNVELLADRGFLGINIDEEYGGGGLSELEAILSIEVVGAVCPDTAQFLYEQQMVGPRAIEMFGTETVKERYLEPVTAGESAIAIGISEPEAGSDVKSMNTTVREEGGELVMNGEKTWVSRVRESDAAVVWTHFDEGLGTVVLDLDADGVEVQQHFTNMAGHEQTHFYIEDVVIPEENVLTRGSDGFKQQLKALNWERLGSSALANAFARNALEKALEYSEDRVQFDQSIGEFQGIEWKLADATKRLQASRALTYSAGQSAIDAGRTPDRLETAVAKLYASEMVETVVSESLQVHGANGYQRGHPLEYLHRLARGRRIAAGTDEIQKNQIAAALRRDGVPEV